MIYQKTSYEELAFILGRHFKEPMVSIIVPTLNEEKNIVRCLKSLKALNYSDYEIILSDGGSTDKTIELAKPFVDKMVIDSKVPDGWIGKSWGCHLGKQQAEGSILLFTDADTFHHPNSLKLAVYFLKEKDVGLLTMQPYQIIQKWWETLVPINFFLSNLTSGGEKYVNDQTKRDSFLGIGQYLLFNRKFYEMIGGHEKIKGSIVEDYAFGRLAKLKYNSLFLMNNYKMVETQMYPDSPKHCWLGWKKCLYPGMRLTPKRRVFIIALSSIWALGSIPAIVLAAIYGSPLVLTVMITTYAVYPLFLWLFWKEKGSNHWMIYLFYPFLLLGFISALFTSTLEFTIRKKTTWKGRSYKPNIHAGLRSGQMDQKSEGYAFEVSSIQTQKKSSEIMAKKDHKTSLSQHVIEPYLQSANAAKGFTEKSSNNLQTEKVKGN
jgi:glycosyltransferase involved in cell wall biosynthesis